MGGEGRGFCRFGRPQQNRSATAPRAAPDAGGTGSTGKQANTVKVRRPLRISPAFPGYSPGPRQKSAAGVFHKTRIYRNSPASLEPPHRGAAAPAHRDAPVSVISLKAQAGAGTKKSALPVYKIRQATASAAILSYKNGAGAPKVKGALCFFALSKVAFKKPTDRSPALFPALFSLRSFPCALFPPPSFVRRPAWDCGRPRAVSQNGVPVFI